MKTASPDDELLTATQVGKIVGRSGRTVIRMAAAGDIPIATKLHGPNGAHLFRRIDADKLAEKLAARDTGRPSGTTGGA